MAKTLRIEARFARAVVDDLQRHGAATDSLLKEVGLSRSPRGVIDVPTCAAWSGPFVR